MLTEPVATLKHLNSALLSEAKDARMAILLGIARGEQAATDRRVVSHHEAKARLKRWLRDEDIEARPV
ncbi:MAG: hypothetical protein FJX59_04805 [Alphaproteobacteria bacterium]|nr:hypothetical protein [Alphaproteobacteria bacterium]